MTYALNEKWSYFIENQGIFKKNDNEFHFGTGAAYLFSNNLQIDASVRTNFFEDYSFLYSSIGIAWRLDRHSDELLNKNSPLNQLYKKKKKRGNIFSRLFKTHTPLAPPSFPTFLRHVPQIYKTTSSIKIICP